MQSFTLDLKTLLQILSRQKQNGILQAELSSDKLRIPGNRQMLQARILLDSGIVRACIIAFSQGGRLVEGRDALQLLLGIGIIDWQWKTSVPQLPPPAVKEAPAHRALTISNAPQPTEPVPRRTSRGEEALQTLPREYRKILALVDGQRSVHKLATILSMKDEEVMAALRVLLSWGLIS